MSTPSPSACGKLILLGEHAVVYGRPALGMGVGELYVEARPGPSPGLTLNAPDWKLRAEAETAGRLGQALRLLEGHFGQAAEGVELYVQSNLPLAAGLGSSAALAVGCVRALAQKAGRYAEPDAQRAIAHELEGVFHGTPSGIDDTIASYGGLCLFARAGASHLAQPSLGPALTAQCRRVLAPLPPLLIGHSGQAHDTRELVLGLRARIATHPSRYEALFTEIEALVWRSLTALAAGDWPALGTAFLKNQALLDELGVGAQNVTDMITLALESGAFGAKLTGAGGGGAVIALIDGEARARLAQAWRAAGYRVFDELT